MAAVDTGVLLAVASSSLLLAIAGTALARRYALHRRLIDQPGARRSHQVATPRGGGIAIVAVCLATLTLLPLLVAGVASFAGCAAAGLMAVAGIGWIDDHRPLSALLRLLVHVAAATMLGGWMYLHTDLLLPSLTVAALAVGLINAWNFMDGINGLAASQAALAALGYALVADTPAASILAVALAAACVGFLPFNMPHARIFLGDVGSGALGYALAMLIALLLAHRIGSADGAAASPGRGDLDWLGPAAALLLPLSACLTDAGLTLVRRILRGERWWAPHVQHLYQRWAARRGHLPVTLSYVGWTALSVMMLHGTWSLHAGLSILYTACWGLGGAVAWFLMQARCSVSPLDEDRLA